MKLLHVIPYFTRKKGGDVNVCFNLSKELASRGHEVQIATTDHELQRDLVGLAEAAGIKVNVFHSSMDLSMFLYSPSFASWMRSRARTFDLIHVHGLRSYQNIPVLRYSMRHRIPLVIQPHASTPRSISKARLKLLYDVIYGYRLVRESCGMIAVSKEEAKYDRDMGADEDKVHVVYNGVDTLPFKNLPPKGRFRSRMGIDNSKRILLYLGRVHRLKGLDFLLGAFSQLEPERRNLLLLIAGPDDGYASTLKSLVADYGIESSVRFVGYMSEEDKIPALVDSDLFVHTVRYMGGVGLAPLEAILSGTPVVVTRECGELIEETGSGYLVEYGDTSALGQVILRALDNPEEARSLALRGREIIMNQYTWDKVAIRIERIYDDCCRRSGGRSQIVSTS